MRTPPAGVGRRTRRAAATGKSTAAADTLDLAELLTVLTAFRKGDFSARMEMTRTGLAGKVADTLKDGTSWQSVLGGTAFDKKGDVTKPDYVFYVWKNGTYAEM